MQYRAPGPTVQGIKLVSTHELPDRLRSIFPFPLFNAVQSKCFQVIYKTHDNFVLSAPTGSGKTAVLELAICRLSNSFTNGSYKVVYQAPTKSLCSERQRDWQAKFGPLGLQCAELTGDTNSVQQRRVQHADIIITTPEKWDSMTRKWKDHQKLVQMVKLFFIDEVHILKENRGATLEAVVSRMKSVGSGVRFVALSATVPNSHDIATWLGKDSDHAHLPAPRERFGEEFRPVRLQKHVCGYHTTANDYAFDRVLNGKLTDVITKWSQRKPIMVFCVTRSACVLTAKLLANWWATKRAEDRHWRAPRGRVDVIDKDLRETVSSGVAFHHAGLQIQDRTAIEKGYLEGEINVICCTSTLAVGVNLPCHMVIIKNTVTYQDLALKEYSDLEIMQMLGRAGRPQFDDSAVAVIMTRLPRVSHYEEMITGQEVLESRLHLNLIDHLNAEIGLGTITDTSSAKKWLSGTFLYVRLRDNPDHYKLESDAPGRDLDERLENICTRGIALLEQHDLVSSTPRLCCTEFGDAMARYYLQFDTMKIFLAMPPKAKTSEILSAISQAAEFHDVRFRANERSAYRELNKNGSIKFPIPVNLDAAAHKVSLVTQAVLGAVELPTEDHKVRLDFSTAKAIIFSNVHRLVRCIIDCQLFLEDSVTVRNALMLARSLGAQVWDDSPLHMKQLEGVGLVSVRKLASGGLTSVEDIEAAQAHRLETLLSRNPPYGAQLQDKAKSFPKLRVALKTVGEPVVRKNEHVMVRVKVEIGFLNDEVPENFQRRPVYVCLLAESSDGKMLHFARISAKKLDKGQDVLFNANLTSPFQTIRAHVMCDSIAGTARQAMVKPDIPAGVFPPAKATEADKQNTSKRRACIAGTNVEDGNDEFGEINDVDLAMAETGGFISIDDIDDDGHSIAGPAAKKRKVVDSKQAVKGQEPLQLANGKWACNHACKDKSKCKHFCCREGLDKKPKTSKPKDGGRKQQESNSDPRQSQLNVSISKKPTSAKEDQAVVHPKKNESLEIQNLNRLHDSVKTSTASVQTLGKAGRAGVTHPTSVASMPRPSFLEAARVVEDDEVTSMDYGDDLWDASELPSAADIMSTKRETQLGSESEKSDHRHSDSEGVDLLSHPDKADVEQSDTWRMTEPDEHGQAAQKLDFTDAPLSRAQSGLFVSSSSGYGSCRQKISSATVQDTQYADGYHLAASPQVDERGNLHAVVGKSSLTDNAAETENQLTDSDELEKWFKVGSFLVILLVLDVPLTICRLFAGRIRDRSFQFRSLEWSGRPRIGGLFDGRALSSSMYAYMCCYRSCERDTCLL